MRTKAQLEALMDEFFASGKPWGEHPDLTPKELQLWLTEPSAIGEQSPSTSENHEPKEGGCP